MSRGVNKAILIGNLGNDPETRYTQGGVAVTRVSIATSSERKDKDGNKVERTEWHRVVFFGKLGEIAGEYLKKGSQVYVEGSIKYDKFTGTDGVEKYTTDIIADEMHMLGGRSDSGERQQPARAARSEPRNSSAGSSRPPMAPPPVDDFVDDDLPF